jgi:hypothetical protein
MIAAFLGQHPKRPFDEQLSFPDERLLLFELGYGVFVSCLIRLRKRRIRAHQIIFYMGRQTAM